MLTKTLTKLNFSFIKILFFLMKFGSKIIAKIKVYINLTLIHMELANFPSLIRFIMSFVIKLIINYLTIGKTKAYLFKLFLFFLGIRKVCLN